ncbi:MAG: hypothetical protein Q9181_007922 [Wetmoreana brouardii]
MMSGVTTLGPVIAASPPRKAWLRQKLKPPLDSWCSGLLSGKPQPGSDGHISTPTTTLETQYTTMSVSLDVVEAPNPPDPDGDGIYHIQELETETGFSSYEAYLEASRSEDRVAEIVLDSLRSRLWPDSWSPTSYCSIMDVNKKTGAADPLTMRLSLSSDPGDYSGEVAIPNVRRFRHLTALQIYKALRSPKEDDAIQVITWYISELVFLTEWVNALGLGLQVPPSFFDALLRKLESKHPDSVVSTHFQHPEHLVIGHAVATLLGGSGLNAPTIFIAHVFGLDSDYSADQEVLELLDLEMDRNLPFNHPRNRRAARSRLEFCKQSFFHYQRLVRDALKLRPNGVMDDSSLYYTLLLPLFKFCALGIQTKHKRSGWQLSRLHIVMDYARRNARHTREQNSIYEELDSERYKLRREIEECENAQHFLVNYIKSNDNALWLSGQSYKTMKACLDNTITVARRLEVEIRDYMQLVVGALSIEESRKSIQLSNTQIQEGKQGLSPPLSRG